MSPVTKVGTAVAILIVNLDFAFGGGFFANATVAVKRSAAERSFFMSLFPFSVSLKSFPGLYEWAAQEQRPSHNSLH